MNVLTVDLGGTRVKAAVVRESAVIAGPVVVATPPTGAAAVRAVVQLGESLRGTAAVDAVGVSVPGLVDQGRIVSLPGKLDGIVGVDLAAAFGAPFGTTAHVVNDAIAYGVGEAVHGAGAGHPRVVVLTVGTGVGVAVVEHQQPLGHGPLGGGLFGGQVPVGPPLPWLDTSGRDDTVEAYCRADRLRDLATAAGGHYADVPAVLHAARAGEHPAMRAVTTYREHLVRALRALVMAHAPSCVVVGGGPVGDGTLLLDGVRAELQSYLWPEQTCDVRPAALGDAAALVGLAELVARRRH